METLFYISIAILAVFVIIYVTVRPRWWRIAWAISAFLSAGFAAPYLINTTPDSYRFLVFIALGLLILAGVAPIAERR